MIQRPVPHDPPDRPGGTVLKSTDGEARRGAGDLWSPRLAAWGFHVACVLAVPFYLYVGRRQWFHLDEWRVLTTGVGSVGDLFSPFNSHLIAPARAMYAALWPVFGLNHYEPYQVPVVLAHVAIAVMIRQAILRTGVSAWLATAVAFVFLTFGRGHSNIIWAFQITFTGSVAAGYAQLLLADHDGPLGRRDALGVLAGLLAVASAAPGLVMVSVTGLAMLLRRGWKVAAVHTVPTAIPFLAWSVLTERSDGNSSPADTVRFAIRGLRSTMEKITPGPLVTVVLVGLVSAGVVSAVRRAGWRPFLQRFAVPLSLATGAVGMFLLTGRGRAESHGIAFAEQSRYSHVGLALLAPLLAVGLQGLVDRWRRLLVPLVVVVVSAVPANLRAVQLSHHRLYEPGFILATAMSPALEHMDPSTVLFPEATGYRAVTAGWLVEARRDGRIPTVDVGDHLRLPVAELVALGTVPVDIDPRKCRAFDNIETTLDAGESVVLVGSVIVWAETPDGALEPSGRSGATPYRLVSHIDRVQLTIGPFESGSARIC